MEKAKEEISHYLNHSVFIFFLGFSIFSGKAHGTVGKSTIP